MGRRRSPLRVLALVLACVALFSCARRLVVDGRGVAARPGPRRASPAATLPAAVGGPRIDHGKHLAKGLECADCHLVGPDGEKVREPRAPSYAVCAECHDDEDAALPEDRRVRAVFFRPDGSPAWQPTAVRYDAEVRWSHEAHASVACDACHSSLDVLPRRAAQVLDMAGCVACHLRSSVPDRCSTCHAVLRDDVAPPSHAQGWRRTHGPAALAGAERCELCHRDPASCDACHRTTPSASHDAAWRATHGAAALARTERCEMCHVDPQQCVDCHVVTRPASHDRLWAERHGAAALDAQRGVGRCDLCHLDGDFCRRCHAVEPPRNHTNLFRTRTHGLLAALDRAKCEVCHETDFCVRCHLETEPRSHGPMWASGPSTHCVQCHLPIASEPSCRVCHFEEPAHSSAPDQPDWHVAGMNCRLCHTPAGNGAPPLRHLDNGTQCEACHR